MNISLQKNLSTLLLFLFSATLFTSTALWTTDAAAHKGHAGKKITFIKKKTALKAMLPSEGKVYRRKQRLDSGQADWASKTYGVDLDTKIYAFYVSKDKKTKQRIGSAIIDKFPYRHGHCELAVGLDANNRVTTAALVSVNERYLVDFEDTVGTGFLKSFDGMTIQDLVSNAKAVSSADKATREFAAAIRDAAITLTAFQYE